MTREEDYSEMGCIIDKDMKCGSFNNLKDLYKNGGEDFCNKHCAGTGRDGKIISRQRARSQREAWAHKRRYPKGQAHRALKKRSRKAYDVPIKGREIAPFKPRKRRF